MTNRDSTTQKRVTALAQFKTAQKMLAEGRADLLKAQDKIEQAQKIIERNADVIRETWAAGRSARISKK
ncbi:MAG TPA: hypothetical protein VFE46_15155 [Pirellulales bacterium]|jgi:hypothetical protein|nr:hypothetical protein [Pirellulales bacterium]